MGLPAEWLRTDSGAGSVDLGMLAARTPSQPIQIDFKTTSGLWYQLAPTAGTHLCDNAIILPLRLTYGEQARFDGGFVDDAKMLVRSARQWFAEKRHIPASETAQVKSAVVTEGARLLINNVATSPIDVAWVVERCDPIHADSHGIDPRTKEVIHVKNVEIF